MRCPPGAIVMRVISLEDNRLIALHDRKPKPLVLGIIREKVSAADAPVGKPALRNHEVVNGDSPCIDKSERKAFNGISYRPPNLNDGKAMADDLLGLLR